MREARIALLLLVGLVRSARAEDAPERITLVEALTRARTQQPSLAIAQQEIERTEGLLREARAAELPALLGTGLFTRLDHDRVTSSGLKIGGANQWNASLSLSVPLLVPTAWSGVSRAKDDRNQARINVDDVSRQLAATVARAYLGVLLERRQVAVAERARDTARAHFEFAHTRLAGGLGTSLDEARAEQELRTDEARVATLRTALARARAALATALSSDHPLDVVDDVTLPALPDVATAADEAQRNRADVKALRARLVGAEHSRKNVWTLYSP
ncbi:MAG TPA: TolC family protein, partial [Polyangia bacterium]|nr:TolC family protein [Polyangia bacterium]